MHEHPSVMFTKKKIALAFLMVATVTSVVILNSSGYLALAPSTLTLLFKGTLDDVRESQSSSETHEDADNATRSKSLKNHDENETDTSSNNVIIPLYHETTEMALPRLGHKPIKYNDLLGMKHGLNGVFNNSLFSLAAQTHLRYDPSKSPIKTSPIGDQISSAKLRFEKKMAELGPIRKPYFYDRAKIPQELLQLAPIAFRNFPTSFLPEYKSPCWVGNQSSLMCLPYFFIGGFPKCATTDLWSKLVSHPDIVPTTKEPQWWTRTVFSAQAIKGYTNHQSKLVDEMNNQNRQDLINCDGSALTFQDNHALINRMPMELRGSLRYITADILRAVLPDIKIVGIIRNPTERAYSAYLYFEDRWKRKKSAENFHSEITLAIEDFYNCTDNNNLGQCAYQKFFPHVNTGCYSFYLRDFLKRFPRDQFFFLRTEDWSSNRPRWMMEIYKFLGLDPLSEEVRNKTSFTGMRNARSYKSASVGPMLPKTKKLLDEFFRPCNEDLAQILRDDKYLWNG